MIPKFTFSDLVKHPVSVFLLTLMASTSVLFFALSRSYEARISTAEAREKKAIADKDYVTKQYILQLKEDAKIGMENEALKDYIQRKDSITQIKLINPLINDKK